MFFFLLKNLVFTVCPATFLAKCFPFPWLFENWLMWTKNCSTDTFLRPTLCVHLKNQTDAPRSWLIMLLPWAFPFVFHASFPHRPRKTWLSPPISTRVIQLMVTYRTNRLPAPHGLYHWLRWSIMQMSRPYNIPFDYIVSVFSVFIGCS